jgi:glycolate oxidase iron-sulfur subunit
LRTGVVTQLQALGLEVRLPLDSHLCCGSAGAYSVLQPRIATELRDRKLAQLQALKPDCILSANVGCIQHLQSGTSIPVKHWIEWLDEAIA